MQAVSEYWFPALQANVVTIVSYGEIWSGIGGVKLATFNVVSGSGAVDASNAVRRKATQLTLVPFPDDPLGPIVPASTLDDLFPDGNEIVLYKGLQYEVDGVVTTEVQKFGTLLMEDVEIFNGGTSSLYIQLNGSDRAETIDRAILTSAYATDGVSTLDQQLIAFLQSVLPGLTYNIVPSTFVPAQMTFKIGDKPWTSDAIPLAASGGYELFLDVDGVVVGRPTPDPTQIAVTATYLDDQTSIQTKVQSSIINTGVPNVILVTSQGSGVDVPLRSVWWDDDPTSATFYNSASPPLAAGDTIPPQQGTYPMTVLPITTSVATTQDQTDAMAQSTFIANRGSFKAIILSVIDNSAQDVDDVIMVNSAAEGIIMEKYVVDSMTVAFDSTTDLLIKGRIVL